MDSLVNQMTNAILIDLDQYYYTETCIRNVVSKTWILKGDASNDFQHLNYSLGKWYIKHVNERYYQSVANISTFVNENKQKFENYQKHLVILDDLLQTIQNELKSPRTFNNSSFCGWNYFETLTIRLNKYDLERNIVIFEGKESTMNMDKLLKFVTKNKKKMLVAINSIASSSKNTTRTGGPPRVGPPSVGPPRIGPPSATFVPYTADERHLRMLRANSTPYKNHRNCMFLQRPLEKRFKVQACKTLVDKSRDPEYLAFVLENFKM